MTPTTLFTATTGSASKSFGADYSTWPKTIVATGFSGSDAVDVEVSIDGGSNYVDVYQNGTQLQLNSTNNVVSLFAPGLYRVNKGATTGSIACYIFEPGN